MEYGSPEAILEADPPMPYTNSKPRSYKDLAAKVNEKMAAKKPAAPAPAKAPSTSIAAPVPGGQKEMPAGDGGEGYQGFGKIFESPEAWKASAELGLARSDDSAQRMMKMGEPRAIPYGGKMSWAEAMNNGIKQGMGMYDYLASQDAKVKALRRFEDLFDNYEGKLAKTKGMGTLEGISQEERRRLTDEGNANAESFWAGR